MAKANSARGRSPLPPAEKQVASSPTLAVPETGKARSKSRSKSRSKTKAKSKAKETSYRSDGVEDHDVFLLPLSDYWVVLALTLVALAVRVYKIYQPSSVVFDEVHFGGFATKYIKGKFFMDVHPPLAKMLIALTGWLAGFDGSFDFKEIGKDYIEPNVPYVAMRMFPAICGVALAPCMYLTLKTLGCRSMTALLGTGLIIFENGLLTQARLILLDSPLVAATAYTALSFNAFTNQHEQGPSKAFGISWWFWLLNTGLGLGITVSIKWVGLFTIAWVGVLTMVQLWVLLGDSKNVPIRLWCKHFMARVFALIVVPVTFYLAMFAIHFTALVNPGEGDGFMSSEFQATLNTKRMKDVPADVVMGSKVSIRHVNTQGGYLHSHPLMYPTGSKQQQITLYPHKDENNLWLLENQTQPLGMDGEPINGTNAWDLLPEPEYIKNGAVLRLYHTNTHRRLHSHDVRPPVSEAEWQNEVSAYGYEGFDGDANDYFRVEIVGKQTKGAVAKERLRTIETKFRLVHVMTGCVLFSHKVKLPSWASEQQEVTCARGGSLPNSLWYIESNQSPHLGPDAEKANYRKPGFFGKFAELHAVMWRTNAGLTDSHTWDSRPESWPILRRGINFWGRSHTQVYLIGNPIVWWSSTIAIVTWVVFKAIAVLRWQRSYGDYNNTTFKRFDYEVGMSVLGWALHYFPFFLMKRQLFLHHYFPALYFGVIALCQVFDYATARIPSAGRKDSSIINKVTAILFLIVTAGVFMLFAPLAYGSPWTKAECNRVKLFPTWDFDCKTFHDSYDKYTMLTVQAGTAATPSPEAVKADAAASKVEEKAAEAVSAKPEDEGENEPRVVAKEETIEFRDQDGNLLNEEQVKSLEGKVEFKTKYETKTRVVDEDGNEVSVGEAAAGVAPPHPDVEGSDPETVKNEAAAPEEEVPVPPQPHDAAASKDGEMEEAQKQPKPASEGKEATVHEEL
ncbi:Dolichyl-phosphate-mannose--protein mannosyltransferase-like protein [Emericellopsis cladophorae]|uniref:Dolichyl-phosphate-mannose--protein mannosyltransferase n=1 Tax=Emericellopsis cladophorae TaxID=2686198 RepID=A0A9P9XV49_9HYPO|nr:Dolichyl-phosphate-mannose--protein mannosyltransferase-like protein [Emericellopsis cladophorae]KAI6777974.1 Dolichyl-phosphate-mannose--protein mannosyltransferase-like protein [Emericellopsis cladophorae]